MITRALVGLVALVALAACREPAPVPVAPAPISSATVRWIAARGPAGTPLLEVPARVLGDPTSRFVVGPPLAARIVAILVRPGTEVAAGAPLVEVALPDAAAAAASYLAAGEQITAHDRRARQLAELRKEGLVRISDVASLELELARLRGEREVAATTLRAAGLAVGDAAGLAARGGRTILRAPHAGMVTKVAAIVGAASAPGESLVELAGGGGTRVEVRLAGPLVAGARFELAPSGGVPIAVRLIAIAPLREADGTTPAWFELATPLPAGQLGRVRAHLPPGEAVTVPATAIGHDPTGAFVWRRAGERPVRLGVRVLATSGAEALVVGPAIDDPIASVASAFAAEVAP